MNDVDKLFEAPNAYLSPTTRESPIQLADVLRKPTMLGTTGKNIYVFGQNLFTLATSQELSNAIADFLKDPTHRIVMVMSNPTFWAGVRAWSRVHPEQARHTYVNHLATAVKNLLELRTAVGYRLELRTFDLMPLSAWFIDPTEDKGVMVITLQIPQLYQTLQRPQFIVFKHQDKHTKQAVENSWEQLQYLLGPGGLVKELEEGCRLSMGLAWVKWTLKGLGIVATIRGAIGV